MQKSEYSGMFGDYSTFSDEMGEDIIASDEANALENAYSADGKDILAETNPAGGANAGNEPGASPDTGIRAKGDGDEI